MFLERFLPGKQFRKPSGFWGLFMARVFDRVNAEENDWVLEKLRVQPTDKVLEVGFGSGRTLEKLARIMNGGLLAGIDYSSRMVRAATRRNKAAIKSGVLKITLGNAESLPYPENTFDKVFAVYVIYFWQNPGQVMKEIWRVLKPGGVATLLLSSKKVADQNPLLQNDFFRMYSDNELVDLFGGAGFNSIVLDKKVFGTEEKICIMAKK